MGALSNGNKNPWFIPLMVQNPKQPPTSGDEKNQPQLVSRIVKPSTGRDPYFMVDYTPHTIGYNLLYLANL